MIKFLLYLWQLPQNLLGLLLTLIYWENNSLIYKGVKIRVCKYFPGGISLGSYVWVKSYPNNVNTWNTVKHEWGHTRQSLYLGPVYLLVVGIVSACRCLIDDWFHGGWTIADRQKWYYGGFPEKWADELGGVQR